LTKIYGKNASTADFLNGIQFMLEEDYRALAREEIAVATGGLTEGEDYNIIVDGRNKGSGAIRSAKLFNRSGIRVTGIGNTKRLLEASRKALSHLQGFPFQQSTGKLKGLIEIRVDGRVVGQLSEQALARAKLVEIYSRARYAGAVEKLMDGRLFLGAAKLADSVPGIAAAGGYGRPEAYDQERSNRWSPLEVPVVRITFASSPELLGTVTATGRAYKPRQLGRRKNNNGAGRRRR
jgi:hypothetical protein